MYVPGNVPPGDVMRAHAEPVRPAEQAAPIGPFRNGCAYFARRHVDPGHDISVPKPSNSAIVEYG